MITIRKSLYNPLFTPRFHLANAEMVGMEIRIKQRQRILSSHETYLLIKSGSAHNLLEEVNNRFGQWSEKVNKPLYLSWELPNNISSRELKLFLNEISLFLPLNRMEIVFDAEYLSAQLAINIARKLFEDFPEQGIRSGLFHSRPLEFNTDDICNNINLFKLKRAVIFEMKDDVSIATKGHAFIEKLRAGNVDIVIDNLYSKSDVTCSILIGASHGQGYFFSRNHVHSVHIIPSALNRTQVGASLDYQADNFHDLLWI